MIRFSRIVAGLVLLAAGWPAAIAADTPARGDRVIADFNSGRKPGNLGGVFGAWIKDPADPMQGAIDSFDRENRFGSEGLCLRLIYSVASTRPAFGGLWFKLGELDASSYSGLALRIKGDAKLGYSSTIRLELKDALGQSSRYQVSGITDQWQDVLVPFEQFSGTANRRRLTELVVVLEDGSATVKQGVLYFDDIRLTGGPS